MGGWPAIRASIEKVAHDVFRASDAPDTITPSVGAPILTRGVLVEQISDQTLIDEVGFHATDSFYELKKVATTTDSITTGPHSLGDFPIQDPGNLYGTLTLAEDSTVWQIIVVQENRTTLFFGLTAPT